MPSEPSPSQGLPIDSRGWPAIDPTANVTAQLSAAVQRLDDLREAEATHVRELMALRGDFDEKLRNAEAARLDAIRRVDVDAVAAAAAVQRAAAIDLANQVAASAEVMRTTVATSQAANTAALTTVVGPMLADIEALKRGSNRAEGGDDQRVERRASTGLVLAVAGAIAAWLTILLGIAGVLITNN